MENDYQKKVLEAALQYEKYGWSVIPVGPTKTPLVPWKEHQTTRATPEQIIAWHKKYPDMGIGVVTGKISGIAVVDIESGGDVTSYPDTVVAATGGGGFHLYFRYPEGAEVGNAVRVRELTDVRGEGGYVVVPPSIHRSGNRYGWVFAPENRALADFPADVLEEMNNMHANAPTVTSGQKIPVGQRNDTATRFIGRMLRHLPADLWESVAWPAAKHLNHTGFAQPLPEHEMRSVFDSISAREGGQRPGNGGRVIYSGETLEELFTANFPKEQWLVEGLIPLGGLTMVSGEPKSFKTFFIQDLAVSVLTGGLYLGRFPVTQGKVLFVDEENPRRITKGRFIDMGAAASKDIVFLNRKGVRMDKPESVEALLAFVEEIQPRLIVIDSLTKVHSKNENQANEISDVFTEIKKLMRDDRAVIVIHHHNKASRGERRGDGLSVRGSVNIFAELDALVAIHRKTGSRDLVVTPGALRNAEEMKAFAASLVADEHGILRFMYQGEQDDKDERITQAKAKIAELFTEEGTRFGVDEVAVLTKLPEPLVRVALRQLEDTGTLTHDVGARNKHFYRLPTSEERAAKQAADKEWEKLDKN